MYIFTYQYIYFHLIKTQLVYWIFFRKNTYLFYWIPNYIIIELFELLIYNIFFTCILAVFTLKCPFPHKYHFGFENGKEIKIKGDYYSLYYFRWKFWKWKVFKSWVIKTSISVWIQGHASAKKQRKRHFHINTYIYFCQTLFPFAYQYDIRYTSYRLTNRGYDYWSFSIKYFMLLVNLLVYYKA